MNRDQWLDRAAKRIRERDEVGIIDSEKMAEALLESHGDDFADDPEGAVEIAHDTTEGR